MLTIPVDNFIVTTAVINCPVHYSSLRCFLSVLTVDIGH